VINDFKPIRQERITHPACTLHVSAFFLSPQSPNFDWSPSLIVCALYPAWHYINDWRGRREESSCRVTRMVVHSNERHHDDAGVFWRRAIKTRLSWCPATTRQTGRRTISANSDD